MRKKRAEQYWKPPSGETSTDSHSTARNSIRWIVYTHLVCVAFCLVLTLADRNRLINDSVSQFAKQWLAFLILPGLLSWIACPFALWLAILNGRESVRTRTIGFMAEVLLVVAQWEILLPLVTTY